MFSFNIVKVAQEVILIASTAFMLFVPSFLSNILGAVRTHVP